MKKYTEWFLNAPKVVYEGPKSDNTLAFRFYNPDEVIAGKSMREHLRFAMSYWHTMCAGGADMFGVETMDKSYGGGSGGRRPTQSRGRFCSDEHPGYRFLLLP